MGTHKWSDIKRKKESQQLTQSPFKGQLRGFKPWGPDCLKCGEPIQVATDRRGRGGQRQGYVHEDPKDCLKQSQRTPEEFDVFLQADAMQAIEEAAYVPKHILGEEYPEISQAEKEHHESIALSGWLAWHNNRQADQAKRGKKAGRGA
jgi:hypothetical protein